MSAADASSGPVDYDVILITDLSFPGGSSSSSVEEIRAQADAGYSTALVHLPSEVLKSPRGFNPKVQACLDEGLADLLAVPTDLVRAKAVLVRHPSVLSLPPRTMPAVQAPVNVMIANQVPRDTSQKALFYDVAAVERNLGGLSSGRFEWAPIGPLVRDALLDEPHQVPLYPKDWHNILRLADWETDRNRFVGTRPVIGRHSRGHYRKWPDTAAATRAAYPTDDRYEVRVLGGADVPFEVLGERPGNWVVYEFDSIPPQDFVKQIDFFVYFQHPGCIEAFGRSIIEAMASGAVAILPEHFRVLFGESAIYCEVDEVLGIVDALYADRPAYAEQAQKGIEFVRANFSWEAHVGRLAERIGPPTRAARPSIRRRRPDIALLLSDDRDGAERAAAIAAALAPTLLPVLASTPGAPPARVPEGSWLLPVQLDLHDHLDPAERDRVRTARVEELVGSLRPQVISYDGASLPGWLGRVLESRPDLPSVWLAADAGLQRLPLRQWTEGKGPNALVIPGELAHATGGVAPMGGRGRVIPLAPVVTAGDTAAGSAPATSNRVLVDVIALTEALGCAATHALTAALSGLDGIEVVESAARADEVAVAVLPAGYHAVHTAVAAGLPAVYVADRADRTRRRRARLAEEAGVGLAAHPDDLGAVCAAVLQLLSPARHADVGSACRHRRPDGAGASEAAALLAELARVRRS